MSGARGEDGSISERVYRLLMRAYPKEFREMYGAQMEQVFIDLCQEETRRGGVGLARFWVRVGLDLVSSAIVERSHAEDKEIAMRDRKYRSIVGVALATALILLIPLLAAPAWTLGDFVFAGAFIFGTGLTYVLVARKAGNIAYRAAVGVALAAAFLIVWVEGAVGINGPTNWLTIFTELGVFAVGFIGAIIARLKPPGMARALFAMALAQSLAAVIALIAGMQQFPGVSVVEILGGNGFFVALFVGSALLFRNAALEQPSAGAGPEGVASTVSESDG